MKGNEAGSTAGAATGRPSRACYFVLGMHRSGTSSIAGVIAKLGATLPANLMGASEGNETGHWESTSLMAFHDELLASAGSRWDDWREVMPDWYDTSAAAQFRARGAELLDREFGDAPVFVFKDPRNCRIARFWLDIFAERGIAPKIVSPIRSPLEVAWSHRARDGFPLRKGLLLWLRHVLDAEAASRGLPHVVVEYDAFLKDWRPVTAAMEQALGTFPTNIDLAAAEIDSFLRADLKHQRAPEEELIGNALVHAWVKQTYEAMRELARKPGSESAHDTLDRIRAQFDEAATLFGGVLADAEASSLIVSQGHSEALERLRQDFAGREAELLAESERLIIEVDEIRLKADEARKTANAQLAAILSDRETISTGFALRKIWRRHSVTLHPINDLSLLNVHGAVNEWKMLGIDPQFAVETGKAERVPFGYYLFLIRLPAGWEQLVQPRMYIDSGNGFNEAESQALNFVDVGHGWVAARIKLASGALRLRFDPSTQPGTFSIISSRLYQISKARFYWPSVKMLLRQRIWKEGGLGGLSISAFHTWKNFGYDGLKNKARDFIRNNSEEITKSEINSRDRYQEWIDLNRITDELRENLRRNLKECASMRLPKISVVCPVYNTVPNLLRQAVESVCQQIYENWELILVDDGSTNKNTRQELISIEASDPRIIVDWQKVNSGISKATNRGVAIASGTVIALLDHDDLLTEDALAEIALVYASDPRVDVVYSDDDKINMEGQRYDPQFKPSWSPVLLMNYMYMSHILTMKRDLYLEVGGCRSEFDGTQDHDLALRVTEKAKSVRHVPKILYHWRAAPGSIAQSSNAKPLAAERGRLCVTEAFSRQGIVADVVQPSWAKASGLGIYAPVFPNSGPTVTIIIPSRNNIQCLQRCVESIKITQYGNYDILVLDNESDDKKTIEYLKTLTATGFARVEKVASPDGKFSFSNINNVGATLAKGALLLFLNDDTEIIDPNWLSQMVGYLHMPGVGTVGARLHYPDGTIQHGGVIHGLHNGLAGHAFRHAPGDSTGYLWYLRIAREYSAVTAACLLTRASTFRLLGGFNEEKFAVAYNDVDYCFRVMNSGLRNIYCGQVKIIHHEGQSRSRVDSPNEVVAYRTIYGKKDDLYYSPNLSLHDENFAIRPRCASVTSRPIAALMVSHDLNLEGAPKCMFDLVVALRARGVVRPHVVSPKDGPLRAEYERAGIEVTILPIEFPPDNDHSLRHFDEILLPLRELMRQNQVDMVYANTLVTFWAISAARSEGLSAIWNPRESFPHETYFNYLPAAIRREAYRCFSYAYTNIFVSNASKNVWKNFDSSYNFQVITDSLRDADMEAWHSSWDRSSCRSELGLADETRCFLALGTVWDHKGQMDLVRALKGLPMEVLARSMFYIIGDRPGTYSDKIKQFISKNLNEFERSRVKMLPASHTPYKYIAAADIGVCCSRVDTFPRVILEYMSFGLPIITTPVFGIAEQVQPDINALIYSPEDILMLQDHIKTLATEDEKRESLAANSRTVLSCLPDFESMVDSYERVFREARFASVKQNSQSV